MTQQKLSFREIKQKYPDQWVSLIDVEKDERGAVKSGVVLASGPDLKVVTKQLKEDHSLAERFEYTGTIKRFLGFAQWDLEEIEHAPPSA